VCVSLSLHVHCFHPHARARTPTQIIRSWSKATNLCSQLQPSALWPNFFVHPDKKTLILTRCVFVCELQEKEEDEKKKAGAQIKKRAKVAKSKQKTEEEKTRGEEEAKVKKHLRLAKTKKEFEEVKKREEETAKEAKEVDKKKAKAQIQEKAKDAQVKIGLEQVKKRGEEKAKEAEVKTKLEEQEKQGRIASDVKSREEEGSEAKKARESAGGRRKGLRRHELSGEEVRALCARAGACQQHFVFISFHPNRIERALSLGVRPF